MPIQRTALYCILLIALPGCSILDDPGTLDGPFTDYHAFANAEPPPRPRITGRYIHFDGTRYVLSARIDCRTQPVDSLSTFELLQLPAGVDVREWIRYHHADFGNEYAGIEPDHLQMLGGSIRLSQSDVHVGGSLVRIHYRLKGEQVVFAGGVEVPSVRTDKLACAVGLDEY